MNFTLCLAFLASYTVRLLRHCRDSEVDFRHSSSHVMCSVLLDVNGVPEMFLGVGEILRPF